jgi:hypothetical protein
MKKAVPILITWDVHPDPERTIENMKYAIGLSSELLKELEIKSTFLFVAELAHQFKKEISLLVKDKQEIGCHGLTHGDEEEYNRMPEDLQRTYLNKATDILQDIAHNPIKTFRGPRVKTSHITHKILEELGYTADCSVGSQRIDFISSNLINIGWIFAPRLPYHPNEKSAFKKGERNIWVVPISAIILPFISSTLNIFKLNFMKFLFNILYRESLRTGKPIVYLVHPTEFTKMSTIKFEKTKLSLEKIRTHGLSFRNKFYERDPQKRFEMNKNLFIYMKSFPDVQFMTVNSFISNMLMQGVM